MAGATVYPTISLLIPLTFFIRLYRTLDANLEQAVEKFTIKTPNLTAEETEFLHKVVNYDTEVNLKYLILNKTQDMYTQNYEKLYKQAEDQMAYNDDHLKIKYKSHFDEFAQFKRVYYHFLEGFFNEKILQHIPDKLKQLQRIPSGDVTAFLLAEEAINVRHERIVKIFDYCLRHHYLHVDDSMYKDFFNHTRKYLSEFVYERLKKVLPEGEHYDYFHSTH